MKTEISKLSFQERKHSLGVFLQMGRVQLDQDWNEQAEISLRLLQRHAADVVHVGSPNLGFRVDDRILLDAMDVRTAWSAEKANVADPVPRLFVDYFDFKTGEGSLSAEGAATLVHRPAAAIDCREWREIVFAAKGSFLATECVFFLGHGGTRGLLTTTQDPNPVDGWRIFRSQPSTAAPAIDLAQVDEYGFTSLNNARKYQIDYIKIDSPIRSVLVPMRSSGGFSATANPGDIAQLRIVDSDRLWHSLALEAVKATSVTYAFPAVRDLSHARKLSIAARIPGGGSPAVTVTMTDATAAAAQVTLAGAAVTTVGSWQVSTFNLPQGAIDWQQVKSIRWGGLIAANTYHFAPVMIEMNPHGNLVIMGGDGTSEGAGRFCADGLTAIKESHETYFSQKDLPAPDPTALAAPAAGKCRSDLAYLDLWERPVTYVEDPDIREIALEGPDTCTRTQLIAQVRLLKGAEVNVGTVPQPPLTDFATLLRFGNGVLTTKDQPDAKVDPCADPCEPAIAGTFLGEENRLFRVEIHKFGQIGAANAASTASFKWSRENGATATALIADAESGVFTAKIEKPELFRAEDLIEISNDLADLVTGPYEDRTAHRAHARGELRKITSINLADRLVSWEDAASPEPQFHAALARPHKLAWHAQVRRWDGVLPVTAGDITLADGVVIEFGGADLLPGDYWVFTTRVADRSVERLIEAPPRGVLHRYVALAHIRRTMEAGVETVAVEDLRPHFDALPELKAAEIAYDPGVCSNADPAWGSVETVQQAIDALCREDIGFDLHDHNKHLHGAGVVCGLQVNCNPDRKAVTLRPGYALDCEGHVLRVRSDIIYPLIEEATKIGAVDAAGKGEVCLSIQRGAAADVDIKVEPAPTLTFWQEVLEGTLLLDFYNQTIKPLYVFWQNNFLPIPAHTVPVQENHKRLVSAINLFFQLVNPATGRYVFLSPTEDGLLRKLYEDLKNLIASKTFCAMFDSVTPFPAYPYAVPTAIDTAFGLFRFHKRIRLHPQNQFAYTCGTGNKIHVFDLATKSLVQSLDFPGMSTIEVQDVAFSPAGDKLYAVGLVNNQDSVFATATIDPVTKAHTWGPATVVCDILFVTLGTTPTHAANLYAIGRSRGLYILNPNSIPLAPVANVAFNATGLMEISQANDIAIVGEASGTPIGTFAANFSRCSRINLGAPALPAVFYICSGVDSQNDITFGQNIVLISATLGAGKGVFRFNLTGGAATGQAALPSNSFVRLAVAGANRWLLVTLADQNRVVRIDLNPAALAVDTTFRIPVQWMPFDIVSNTGRGEVYVLNVLSSTLTIVNVSGVLTGPPPPYTVEPPVTLSAYRHQMIQAYFDLLGKFMQYLKDSFCDQFLVNCPACGPDDKVYLGCVEIENNKVFKVCNFTRRRYVKSVQLVEYWLSTIPVIPIVKKAFAEFCCKVL
jgi:hypothetical protein